MPVPDLQSGLKVVKAMGRRKAVPLLKEWQADMLLDLLTDFYAVPENRQAFETWKKNGAGRTVQTKSPPVQRTPASLQGDSFEPTITRSLT